MAQTKRWRDDVAACFAEAIKPHMRTKDFDNESCTRRVTWVYVAGACDVLRVFVDDAYKDPKRMESKSTSLVLSDAMVSMQLGLLDTVGLAVDESLASVKFEMVHDTWSMPPQAGVVILGGKMEPRNGTQEAGR